MRSRPPTTETTAKTPPGRNPWFTPSYAWVLVATLSLQVGLNLSQLFGGLGKGRAVLIPIVATAGLPLWFIAFGMFRLRSEFGLRSAAGGCRNCDPQSVIGPGARTRSPPTHIGGTVHPIQLLKVDRVLLQSG